MEEKITAMSRDNYMEWISVEDKLPPNSRDVLALQNTGYNDNRVIVVAQYARKFELEISGEWDELSEYCAEKDQYFCPEGWYEQQVNWGDYAYIHINEQVTHWMPLPEPPKE